MVKSSRPLALLAGLVLALAARAGTTLAPVSPFAPPEGGSASASSENQPLELRGILMDSGGYRFSVYDPAKKTGQWVRLNEPGHDFTVRTHDVARDTITLDYQGRTLSLPLHNAKVVGLAVAQPSPGGDLRPMPGGNGMGPGPQPKPGSPEETARFNRAVEEINRRRALREKGFGSPAGQAPMATRGQMQGQSSGQPSGQMSGQAAGQVPVPVSGPIPVPSPSSTGPILVPSR